MHLSAEQQHLFGTQSVTGSQRHLGQKRSQDHQLQAPVCEQGAPMCICMCRVCPCVQSTRSCGLQTHMHAGGMGMWMYCVCTHMQAGLACRGCKVCYVCVHPTRQSGALPPHEVWGCEGGCSPLPNLTSPGHWLRRDPSFTECHERNFCFFIPAEHPSLGPLED